MARRIILARSVGHVPLDPQAPEWQRARPEAVPLSPQVLVKPRIYEVGVEQLQVRALYDAERLGLLLEWQDSRRDIGLGRTESFRDAVAIQFPAEPSRPIPYFAMGEPGNPVVIYQWKADWELGPDYDADEAHPHMWVDFYPYGGKGPGERIEGADYGAPARAPWPTAQVFNTAWWTKNPLADPALKRATSVEKLTAAGFGSLTHQPPQEQDGQGKAIHNEAGWHVVISLPRQQAHFHFEPGTVLPVNFAVWDGANGERGGEKAVGSWSFLALERRVGLSLFALPPAVAAAVAGALWVLTRRIQAGGRDAQA